MPRIFMVILLSVISTMASAEIYKWTDSEGKVHFSDQKPDSAKVEKVHVQINSYEHVTYQLPPIPVTPALRSVKNVVMYSTTWCGYASENCRF